MPEFHAPNVIDGETVEDAQRYVEEEYVIYGRTSFRRDGARTP
jgi:hypothetical protein